MSVYVCVWVSVCACILIYMCSVYVRTKPRWSTDRGRSHTYTHIDWAVVKVNIKLPSHTHTHWSSLSPFSRLSLSLCPFQSLHSLSLSEHPTNSVLVFLNVTSSVILSLSLSLPLFPPLCYNCLQTLTTGRRKKRHKRGKNPDETQNEACSKVVINPQDPNKSKVSSYFFQPTGWRFLYSAC